MERENELFKGRSKTVEWEQTLIRHDSMIHSLLFYWGRQISFVYFAAFHSKPSLSTRASQAAVTWASCTRHFRDIRTKRKREHRRSTLSSSTPSARLPTAAWISRVMANASTSWEREKQRGERVGGVCNGLMWMNADQGLRTVDEMGNISGLISVLQQSCFHMYTQTHTRSDRITEAPHSFQRHINHVNCTRTLCCTFCTASLVWNILLMPPPPPLKQHDVHLSAQLKLKQQWIKLW